MGKHTVSKKAMCCFYRSEGRQIIYCGLSETVVHRVFGNATKSMRYKEQFCRSSNHCNCTIYSMLKNIEKQ